jgi:GAF domain-containing protein
MTDEELLDPTEAFAEINQIRLSDTNLDGVLNHLARLAKRTIPGAAEVSVTLSRGEAAYTAAFSGELALSLDETQYEQGHGPCLHALASGEIVPITDMGSERRWPQFAAHATQAGCHSSLSVGLPVHESVAGAMNIYATEPQAFDDDAVALAQAFAGYAAVALANAHLYDTQATLAHHMQTAMASRAVIEQAKGIIMGDRRCTPEQAFKLLTKMSQDTNRKLRDVAQTLVDRAAAPRP